MKKLLGVENIGGRIQREWLHWGDDGRKKVTTETVQDVEPIFNHVKRVAETRSGKGDFRYRATIPYTVIDEASKIAAKLWGVRSADAFREIMSATPRGKRVLDMLTKDSDYRKFQAR